MVHRHCAKADTVAVNADMVKVLRLILEKEWDMLKRLKIDLHSQKLLYYISEGALASFHS